MEKSIIVAIDPGTSKICTLVAQTENENSIRILGVGIEPSQGIRKGSVVDLPLAAGAIAKSIKKAERTSGLEVTDAIVSIAGSHISSMNNKATVGIVGGVVDQYDINRVQEAVRLITLPNNRLIIHPLQRTFSIDGVDGIRNPLNMHGTRLDLEAHIITGAASTIENMRQCVMTAEVDVSQFVLSPLADAEVLLTDIERQMGVVVCDIGGGTTGLAIYINGSVWHTNIVPVGGNHITNDISQAFHLPLSQAEEVKKIHGNALPEAIGDEEYFYCRTFGKDEAAKFSRKELSQIIGMRMEEIFQLILQEIKRSGFDNLLPAGMVLTGGTSLLPGIDVLGSKILGMPIRIAKPENMSGMIDQLDSPAYSTSVGLLYWALLMQESTVPSQNSTEKKSFGERIRKLLRYVLP